VALVVAWLLTALGAAVLTARADDRLHRLVEAEQRTAVRAEHRATLRDQFRGIVVPGIGGLPDQYHITDYGPTPDGRFLVPVFPPAVSARDTAIFERGSGATGKAWEDPTGAFVVRGAGVSDASHGLTAVQQRRYKMFEIVAAVVIRDDAGAPIGVLTAIGREDDGFFDATGIDALKDLADGIAWLIPEAVRWMMPQEEP
jgi:hypothetical protein